MNINTNTQHEQPPSFEDGLLKFSDCLVASTSSACDQIFVWEPATMAPLETFKSDKFLCAANTLNVQRDGHMFASHVSKTTMAAWRWDRTREPCLRSPLKEETTVLKAFGTEIGQQFLLCGTRKGTLSAYHTATGTMLAEIEQAHYLAITDLDVSPALDLVATAGKDSKVRIWLTNKIMQNQHECLWEFGDASGEVTAVKFSKTGPRLFTSSLDKVFRAYDLQG